MTKKRAVKVNPSIIETETNKRDIVDLDPNCEFCLKKIPIHPARIERIKDALSVWLDQNPKSKTISEFYHAQQISMKTYYRLLQRDAELKDIHDITLRRMGNKLWGDSVDLKTNWNAVKFMIHHYGPEFKEAREFEAQLTKKDDHAQQGPQFIVIKDFESSELVPERKRDIQSE